MSDRSDPREWTHDRLTFAIFKLFGLPFTLRGQRPQTGYDQAVLVRARGRNALETYSVSTLLFGLYLAAAVSLLELAGFSDLVIGLAFPLPLLVALALLVGVSVAAGGVATVIRPGAERLALSGAINTVFATVIATLLVLHAHWTRWFGLAWFTVLALNGIASLLVLLARPWLRRISAEVWRDTQFVE